MEIAGEDEVNYGGKKPPMGSWGRWAKAYLNQLPEGKVKWLGRMPIQQYANWLKSSWCHLYLSEPFVTSWSFLEASSCNIPIVASKYQSIIELAPSNQNILYVDHHNRLELTNAVLKQLQRTNEDHLEADTGLPPHESRETHLSNLILQIGNRPHWIDPRPCH